MAEAELVTTQVDSPDETPQILHGAKYGDDCQPDAVPLETRIAELLDRIGEGLREDDATNFEKLQIARRYGAFVKELKSLTPHGEYMKRLKEHFPKPSYDKCNRWRYLAENEDRVATALETYPDVVWGPKKMIDYLKGCWSPEAELEEDRFDGDEDEYGGYVPSDLTKTQTQEFASDANAAEVPTEDDPDAISDEEEGGDAETGVVQSTPNTRPKKQSHQVVASKASTPKPNSPKPKEKSAPASAMIDYDVEVRLGFKLSVPSNLTADDIEATLKNEAIWAVELDTSFDNLVSEVVVIVTTVQLWDSPKKTTR